MRWRLTIEYDGSPYLGWQSQRGGGGVQDALSDAVEKLCGERRNVFGAGRTDRGVHARGQVGHLDLEDPNWTAEKVMAGLNFHLKPAPLAVLAVARAREDFDARFSALARHYEYKIISRRAPLTVDLGHAWFVPYPLDLALMQEAAKIFVGHHDFTTFRSSQCQADSAVKTLSQLEVSQAGEAFTITASAPSFLHHQVRSLAGVLKVVGDGKFSLEQARGVLQARDRTQCPQVAPAEGLTFMKVEYPAELLAAPDPI